MTGNLKALVIGVALAALTPVGTMRAATMHSNLILLSPEEMQQCEEQGGCAIISRDMYQQLKKEANACEPGAKV